MLSIKYSKDQLPYSLPWQLQPLKFSGAWPLSEENPKKIVAIIYNIWIFVLGLCFFLIVKAEIAYFVASIAKINTDSEKIVENLCTTLVGLQVGIRVFHAIAHRNDTRVIIQEFYYNFYTDETHQFSDSGRMLMKPVEILTTSYAATVLMFTTMPFFENYMNDEKDPYPMPYPMIFPYSLENVYAYWMTYIAGCVVGISVATFLLSEMYMIGNFLSHLSVQFISLNHEIDNLFANFVKKKNEDYEVNFLNKKLEVVIEKQTNLRRFGEKLNAHYSFRYFLSLMCSTILMCLTVFQISNMGIQINSMKFFFWATGAVGEQMALGYIASELISLSENMSTVYYSCNWEDILTNPEIQSKEKISLMKDILIAMTLSRKPIQITGLNFFNLSIVTSFDAVRTSASYFMFLNTMRKVK